MASLFWWLGFIYFRNYGDLDEKQSTSSLDPSYVQPSILVEELQKSIQRIEALHMSYIRDVQKELDKIHKIFGDSKK